MHQIQFFLQLYLPDKNPMAHMLVYFLTLLFQITIFLECDKTNANTEARTSRSAQFIVVCSCFSTVHFKKMCIVASTYCTKCRQRCRDILLLPCRHTSLVKFHFNVVIFFSLTNRFIIVFDVLWIDERRCDHRTTITTTTTAKPTKLSGISTND